MSDSLKHLSERVADDPLFLASVLKRYAEANGLDDQTLAEQLSLDVAKLSELRLCLNPDPKPPRFWKDIEAIATRFGLDADRFAQVVREGQTLIQLQAPTSDSSSNAPGYLMAARDREEPPPDPET